MLCKVTHCAGRVSTDTRPHQLRWGDRDAHSGPIYWCWLLYREWFLDWESDWLLEHGVCSPKIACQTDTETEPCMLLLSTVWVVCLLIIVYCTASDVKLRSLGTSVVKSCNKKLWQVEYPRLFAIISVRTCVAVFLTCKLLLPTYMHVFIHEDAEKWDSFGGPITARGSVLTNSLKCNCGG